MTKPKITKALLIIGIGLCLIAAIVTYTAHHEKLEAQFWVNHTYEVITETGKVVEAYQEIEIVRLQRIVSSSHSAQANAIAAVNKLRQETATLRNLIADNPAQTMFINELQPLLDQRIKDDLSNAAATQRVDGTTSDITSIDSIEVPMNKLIQREKELLKTRHDTLVRTTSFMVGWIYVALVLISLTIIAAFVTIRNVQGKNEDLVNTLEHINETLEKKVTEQTRKIIETNTSLSDSNKNLTAVNQDLLASEEELRSSVEYISELKNDLEIRERQYRLLAEHSQDMIMIINMDNVIEYASPASKIILHYEPEEIVGKKSFGLVCAEDSERAKEQMNALNKTGISIANFQFRMVRKNGSLVWVESQTTPILGENGLVVKRQTTIRDITISREAAEQILDAKQKAEEATLAKSQFLSTMSHEIRTPMNAVIGLSHILLQNDPRPDQVESLNLLKFSAENLLSIINDILDFSKIEASKVTLEAITFNLRQLLVNAKTVQQKKADDKGIQLHLSMGKDLPEYVVGDSVRLHQVIANLISNAIKFTEKGYVELRVDGEPMDTKSVRIKFSVVDSGIGIENEKLNDIFESFSQANSDTTRKFGGTGLGLAISKRLVEMMGGKIHVKSSLNYGSTFSFEIELPKGTEDQAAIFKQRNPIALRIRNARALVAEDNRVNQIVAGNFLRKWKIDVDFAENGIEALKMVQTKAYHIVLMDLQMPEMDGYTAAKEIRSLPDPYFKSIPIIALTASSVIEVHQQVSASGMNDFITKPFDPEDLRVKIFSYLNEQEVSEKKVSKARTASIDFYTQADPALKNEITRLLVKNITELHDSIKALQSDRDAITQYRSTVHKVKTALRLLDNMEFENDVEILTKMFLEENANTAELDKHCNALITVSRKIIDDLNQVPA